ncbi:MAG: hypothetical protein ABIR92_09165 [Gemmatimonadaceae bacterium]
MIGASAARGQMVSPTASDATVVTRGAVRFRGEIQWTRIDGVFGGNGTVQPRGSALTTDVNSSVLPLLSDAESAARTLAADPSVTLTAGQLRTSVDSRIASVPLSFEYGLTSRITIGALVPIVQSRSVVSSQLNGPADSSANVGTNPAFFHQSATAYAANAAVAVGLSTARDQLEQRLSQCAASPTLSGCPALNARSAEATALLGASTNFAFGVATLYGISPDQPGAPFAPIAGSNVQTAIDSRLASLRASFTSFGFSSGTAALAPAQAPAANTQFSRIVNDVDYGIEVDSIGTTTQTTVGDIELSVGMLLFNSFANERGVRLRGVATGVVRLGTGHPARANRPFDVPTGDGQTDIEVRAALDAMIGRRFLTTVAGTYTAQMGSVPTTRLPSPPGSVFALDFPVSGSVKPGHMASVRINPRYMITPALMVGALGIGSFRAADQVTVTGFAPDGATFGNQNSYTLLAGGLTIGYSNLASATGIGGRGFPAEIVFSHLETLSASMAGAEKSYRDSIELRYYFRTRR